MSEQTQLIHSEQNALPAQAPVAEMLQSVIKGGVTAENVAVLDKLVGLYERMQDREAERQFNSAFVALQQDLPVIVASTIIPNRGKYERFEDLMQVVGPLLTKHGFSVSFSQDAKDGRVLETCHLRHIGGHSQANSFGVRTGKADSDTQADVKASTTAKRCSFMNSLNLVIRQDAMTDEGDATLQGAPIDFAEAKYLREQIAEKGANEATFLKMAGADTIETIGKNIYPVLLRALAMKKPAAAQ